jgi:uncharacterized protein YxjI
MKFYIKQKVFSWKDRFNIFDEYGNEAYWVEGSVFTIGKKLDLYDMANNHMAHIHQKVLSFLPRYFIEMNGTDVAEVVKHFTLFTQKFSVSGFDWHIQGDFFAHEYEIYRGDYTIATISKEWFTFGDAYSIEIVDGVDPVGVISVVLIIDAILAQSNNNSSAHISFNG